MQGDAKLRQPTLGESHPRAASGAQKKNVYWVIICPNSSGANGRMKGRARPHTYAWL